MLISQLVRSSSVKWILAVFWLTAIMFWADSGHSQEGRGAEGRRVVSPFGEPEGERPTRPPREGEEEVTPSPSPGEEGAVSATPVPSAEAVLQKELAAGEEFYSMNFERMPVGTIAKEILEALGVNYIADPRMDAAGMEVTVRTTGKVRKSDLFPLLEALLRMKGFSLTKVEDNYYQIETLQPAKPGTIPAVVGEKVAMGAVEGMILQIVPMKYVSPVDMVQILPTFLSKSGAALTDGLGNNLLLVDYPQTVERLLEIVRLLDVPPTEKSFIVIENAELERIVSDLEQIFSYWISASQKGGAMLQFVPLESLGGILVKNSSEALLPEVLDWVKLLDAEAAEKGYQVYYYTVKARPANVIKEILEEFFKGVTETEEKAAAKATSAAPRTPSSPVAPRPSSTSAPLEEELYITVDATRNLLIVYTTPDIYKQVKELIAQIDQPPRQVLIEATIAEVSLKGTYELGLEWAVKAVGGDEDQYQTIMTFGSSGADWPSPGSFPPAGPLGGGLNYLITQTNKFLTLLRALETENRLHVLASPTVLASMGIEKTKEGQATGKQAVIDVLTQVPIRTSISEEGVISERVEYKDAPIKLTVTPLAIWEDSVTLDIVQVVTTVEVPEAGGDPGFNERRVETEVTIADGQTLVIGGLIQRTKETVRQSVPILGKIPLVGPIFFQYKSRPQDVNTEIVVVITPRIIESLEQGDAASARAKEVISALKEEVFVDQLELTK